MRQYAFVALIALVVVWKIAHFVFSTTSTSSSGFDLHPPMQSSLQLICTFSKKEVLSSFIYSHRASAKTVLPDSINIDGSPTALSYLLDAGITNFDIDVSYFNDSFYVAHPSIMQIGKRRDEWYSKELSTVSQFLQTLTGHPRIKALTSILDDTEKSNYLLPFVTLEPKFSDADILAKFVNVLRQSSLALGHIAVIVSTESQLALVNSLLLQTALPVYSIKINNNNNNNHNVNHYNHNMMHLRDGKSISKGGSSSPASFERPEISVALAYRSVVTSPDMLDWNRDDVITLNDADKRESATFSVTSSSSFASPVHLSNRILMPDVKLLDQGYTNQGGGYPRVVSWLVDDRDSLIAALHQNVQGVVTNRPVQLLNDLQELYAAARC